MHQNHEMIELLTVFPSTVRTLFTEASFPADDFASTQRSLASSGEIMRMLSGVGSRRAMFSGVFSASSPVLVIMRISGKALRPSSSATMKIVPFAM